MATEIEENVEQILYRNEAEPIARGVIDLLLQTGKPGVIENAVALLYRKTDHYFYHGEAGRARYIAEREQAISAGAPSAQSARRVESL